MFEKGAMLFNRYQVHRLIARGGMADVFFAFDTRLERNVAIKGPTLATGLAEGPMPAPDVRRLGADLASALSFVHDQRIVHRDVKPSNVLLAPDGRSLLGDFGVAVLLDATRFTTDEATVGTAAYLTPEQVNGEEVTSATDVYALGLVLLEAATGTPAYTGSFHEIMAAKVRADPVVPASVQHELAAVLTSMLAREPAARPSAATVAAALNQPPSSEDTTVMAAAPPTQILERSTTSEAALAPTAPAGRDLLAGRRLAIVAAAIAVVLILGIGIAALLGDGEPEPPAPPAHGSTTEVTPATMSETPSCTVFEDQKRGVEAAKQRAEQTYKHDKDTLEDLKKDLEEQKKTIEEQKRAAGC